ncbi:MAG TPA: hypothetical protein PK289_08185, partial [Bacteroidia bacterium]|nr:hypothetical protein [Bacteroidia bacterium]
PPSRSRVRVQCLDPRTALTQRVRVCTSAPLSRAIMALSTTMEGDTTNFYIYKRLKEYNITISTIARGISIGDELAYADEVTLGRSIVNRMPYENSLSSK